MNTIINEFNDSDSRDFIIEEDISKISHSCLKSEVLRMKNAFIHEQMSADGIKAVIEQLRIDPRKNVQSLSHALDSFLCNYANELSRVKSMMDFDKSFGDFIYAAGIDEVGRGPLAGPIVSAAVVLNLDYKRNKDIILGIKDSKQLSQKSREELSLIIKDKAVSYSIASIENTEIDEKGIGWCNNEVFIKAIAGLKVTPDLVLSDGYPVKGLRLKNEYIIKGDTKSASIACASIIAKVFRDNLMADYSKEYPFYGFENNSGYGSKEHISAIVSHGPCKLHRMSFLRNIV